MLGILILTKNGEIYPQVFISILLDVQYGNSGTRTFPVLRDVCDASFYISLHIDMMLGYKIFEICEALIVLKIL